MKNIFEWVKEKNQIIIIYCFKWKIIIIKIVLYINKAIIMKEENENK